MTKGDAADKITAVVSPLVADRTFSQAFPHLLWPPSSLRALRLISWQHCKLVLALYRIRDSSPKRQDINDYVNAIKKDLDTVTKDEASIKAALEGKFKTSAFALGIKFDDISSVQADFSLSELEQLIYNNFQFDAVN